MTKQKKDKYSNVSTFKKVVVTVLALFAIAFDISAQVNFVGNPSFEIFHSGCAGPNFAAKLKYWNGLDSLFAAGAGLTYNTCYGTVPYAGPGLYQLPRTGNGHIRFQDFCTNPCGYYVSRNYAGKI